MQEIFNKIFKIFTLLMRTEIQYFRLEYVNKTRVFTLYD